MSLEEQTSVRIYKPAKTATQSGRARTKQWILECEQISERVPDALIGWISSEDTLNQIRISFDSREEAVAFAESRGLDYKVDEAQVRKLKPRNYLDNFKFQPFEEEKK